MTAHRPLPPRPRVAAVAWLLVLALLVAQALGVVHRTEHGRGGDGGPIALSALSSRSHAGAGHEAGLEAHRSHVGETGERDGAAQGVDAVDALGDPAPDRTHDCAAFDHATVGESAPMPAAPALGSAAVRIAGVLAPDAPLLAAEASGYLARGPPAA